MSTSPTLMSWRRKSSVKRVSSANSSYERSFKPRVSGACPTRLPISRQIRSVADGTSKTGKGPWLKGKADHRCGEKYFCRTFQSEYFLCSVADPIRPLARHWRDCLRPKPSPCPIDGHRPVRGDSPVQESRWSPAGTPDFNREAARCDSSLRAPNPHSAFALTPSPPA